MATYFISDLHLSETKPHLSALFLKFLRQDAKKADALYILGDLFEAWLGDDNADPDNISIINALAEFSETGIPVYFMHGNRDFLIGDRFTVESHCELLQDPVVVELYNTPVLLTHGDLLCTLDHKYQRFRKFVRHPLIKKLFFSFPLCWRKKISSFLRKKSTRADKKLANRKWDVTSEAVYQILREHKSLTLIHGHTHKPGIHHFILDNQPAKRIVLGDWGETGSVLIYSPENLELKTVI
ncbi:MAG TPA: UDP-2,3-diacylglucosamine diphosphatase [Gammaproteobacteria bacterium]|nr:UDP-2,3-diacylglucosamine diphosphatase [Gammaproteobacteria bacterium]HQZ87180.1 UDP-2,3-diacylglucosamine diphosphatase [Gammaproteobacteria bacterium]HRA43115.1 UDP-2,3-diacylglucosamine diphosphatase [Gammaproteobacteria bacterium]